MRFIDIHTHITWDVDDGIASKEDSIEALKIASQQGIEKIVATPHVVPGITTDEELVKIQERIEELKEIAKEYKIDIYSGCELFMNHEAIDAIYHQHFLPIENTKYLLIESDVRKNIDEDHEFEDCLYEVHCSSYRPIIAHVERYFHDGIDLEKVQEWIDEGAVIQVNTSSILGYHGKTVQKNAMKLLDYGLVHVIATDTHRSNGKRIPNLEETFNYLRGKVDPKNLQLLGYINPLHIIQNEEVEKMVVKKPSFLKKLFGGK